MPSTHRAFLGTLEVAPSSTRVTVMEQRKLSEEVVSFRTNGVVKVSEAVDPSWILNY